MSLSILRDHLLSDFTATQLRVFLPAYLICWGLSWGCYLTLKEKLYEALAKTFFHFGGSKESKQTRCNLTVVLRQFFRYSHKLWFCLGSILFKSVFLCNLIILIIIISNVIIIIIIIYLKYQTTNFQSLYEGLLFFWVFGIIVIILIPANEKTPYFMFYFDIWKMSAKIAWHLDVVVFFLS